MHLFFFLNLEQIFDQKQYYFSFIYTIHFELALFSYFLFSL